MKNNALYQLKKEIKKHLFDYLFLLSASIFFIIVLGILKGNSFGQFIVLVSYVILYLLWSITHHIKLNTLNYKIMLEYILISGTALFLLRILILK